MQRREFIMLLGGATAWPLAARAQQPGKLPTIGFLGAATPSAWSQWVAAFVQRLRELGWIDGRTVVIEFRWAEGRTERYAEIAAEFVRLKVDVIVRREPRVLAAKQATSIIPIVFAWRMTQLATAWSRASRDRAATSPDCRSQAPILQASGSNFCARLFPGLRRLAILANIGNPMRRAGDARSSGSGRNARPRGRHDWKSGEPRISRLPSRHQGPRGSTLYRARSARKHQPRSKSTPWRSPHDCRRCTGIGSTSKREV